jgi:hypothetical protein
MTDAPRPGRYRQADQAPPDPQRISDGVVMRFEHVYEVDPALMGLPGLTTRAHDTGGPDQ